MAQRRTHPVTVPASSSQASGSQVWPAEEVNFAAAEAHVSSTDDKHITQPWTQPTSRTGKTTNTKTSSDIKTLFKTITISDGEKKGPAPFAGELQSMFLVINLIVTVMCMDTKNTTEYQKLRVWNENRECQSQEPPDEKA